jgi:hypothetical protein
MASVAAANDSGRREASADAAPTVDDGLSKDRGMLAATAPSNRICDAASSALTTSMDKGLLACALGT